jgi:hypothetical protein
MRIWNDNEIKFVEKQFIICEKRYS